MSNRLRNTIYHRQTSLGLGYVSPTSFGTWFHNFVESKFFLLVGLYARPFKMEQIFVLPQLELAHQAERTFPYFLFNVSISI